MTLIPPTRIQHFLITSDRKRNRSFGEEDFLPLSKKINNLHINNWGNIDNSGDQALSWNSRTGQWVASQHSLLVNSGRPEESLNSSLLESAHESAFPNNINETDRNTFIDKDSRESTSSQLNCEKNNIGEDGQNPWSMVYEPDLNMEENPFYYENNKLLFELHVERLRRGVF